MLKGGRDMQQALLFKTIDELHAHAEKFHSHIRFEFESDYILAVKMHNELIAKLRYESVTQSPDGLKMYIIKGSNMTKFNFLFDHIDLLDQLMTSEDVKEVEVRPASIFFNYKENYSIYYSCHTIPYLSIAREESYSKARIAELPHFSKVFEVLDENIPGTKKAMASEQIRSYFIADAAKPKYSISFVESDKPLECFTEAPTYIIGATIQDMDRLMSRIDYLKWLNVEIVTDSCKFYRSLTVHNDAYYLFCNESFNDGKSDSYILTRLLDIDIIQESIYSDMLKCFDEDFLLKNKYLTKLS